MCAPLQVLHGSRRGGFRRKRRYMPTPGAPSGGLSGLRRKPEGRRADKGRGARRGAMRLSVRLRPGAEARFPGGACEEAALLTETPTISHARTHARTHRLRCKNG